MFFKDFRWHLPKHLCVNGKSFQNAVSLESGQPLKSPLSFRLVFQWKNTSQPIKPRKNSKKKIDSHEVGKSDWDGIDLDR